MNYTKSFLLITSILSCTAIFGQASNQSALHKAIICLTYDDGLESQLLHALPALDSAELKATFFLNAIQGSSASNKIGQTPEAVLGWTSSAKAGHELANHTLFHACPARLGWDSTLAVDKYTVSRIITEIQTQNVLLSLLDPRRQIRSFAFPCNNSMIRDTNYVPIIKKMGLISYARTGGDSNSVITNFQKLDVLAVPSWLVPEGTSVEALIAFAEKAKKSGGMAVYQFHGIGGQIFATSIETHKAFIAYLKLHERDYWVTTFSQAMDAVTKQTR